MLDDYAAWLFKLTDTFDGGIGIGNIVVGKLLALQLFCGSDTGIVSTDFLIEGGVLVRVLTVAHVLQLFKAQV